MKTNWQTERTMTPVQYRAALKDLDMNVAQAARYLGVGERTSHRYIRGETSIPVSVVLLLRALKAMQVKPLVPVWISDRKNPRARPDQMT